MAHAQKSDFVFRRNGRGHLNLSGGGASVQSTTGSWGVRISCSNAGYTMFRGSVKGTGYPLHSPVYPPLSPPVRHRAPSHSNWTLPCSPGSSWWGNKLKTHHPIHRSWTHLAISLSATSDRVRLPESGAQLPHSGCENNRQQIRLGRQWRPILCTWKHVYLSGLYTPTTRVDDSSGVSKWTFVNLLTPNVNNSGRTAPLTSKVAFYIFIQQI